MKVVDFVVTIFVICFGIMVIIVLIYLLLKRSVGVRREAFLRMRKQRDLAESHIDGIEDHVTVYSDLESPLATSIREEIRAYRKMRRDIP